MNIDMNVYIKLFLIMTPTLYTILLSIIPIITKELELFIILVNYVLFGKIFNSLEKSAFKFIQGENSKIGKRPNPIGSKLFNNKYDKCSIPINILKPWKLKLVDKDYYSKGNKPTWGFPSGHSQESSFVATILTLYLINNDKKNKNIYITLLWILNISVMYQRVSAGCHTLLQVIVGDLFGILFGILSYYQICHRFFPDKFPTDNINKIFNIKN